MFCLTRSFSLKWSRGKSFFSWIFKNGNGRCVGGVILTHGSFLRFGFIRFDVFGLEVGSSAFPTSFHWVVCFVAIRALSVLFFGRLAVIAFLFLLSFEISTVILDVSRVFAKFACCRECRQLRQFRLVLILVQRCVTISSYVAFSSRAILTEQFSLGGSFA